MVGAQTTGGFTLLEVLVVLAIIAVVATFVPPVFSKGAAVADIHAKALEIASALRYTRSLAIRENRPAAVSFDLAKRTYGGPGDVRQRSFRGFDMALYTVTAERIAERSGGIRFFPDGSSTGGRVRLQAANGNAADVDLTIDWLTGRVDVILEPAR